MSWPVRLRSSLIGLACGLLTLTPSAGATPSHEESFRDGIRAGDRKKWQEAAAKMAEAVAGNPNESKQRIALSGVFSAPYLPHFYRGWYLYQLGTEHCETALRELEISRDQGVVQGFKKQLENLETAREICGARVLPPAITEVEKTIATVERGLEAQGALDAPNLRQKKQRVQEQLDAARSSLESGRQETRLSAIQRAASEAEAAVSALTELDQEVRRHQQAEVGRTQLESSRPVLTRPTASIEPTTPDLENDVETEAAQIPEPTSPPIAEPAAPPARESTPPPPSAPVTPTPTTAPSPSTNAILLSEVERLTDSAELFLDRISGSDASSELLELQRSRLSELVLAAKGQGEDGATTDALETLLGRLSDSLQALQLIAGAQAYFAGNPQRAVDLLGSSDPPASALGAHYYLFLSASRFALFQVGVLESTVLASADARRCRDLDPELSPDPRAFSPSFRQFFGEALAR